MRKLSVLTLTLFVLSPLPAWAGDDPEPPNKGGPELRKLRGKWVATRCLLTTNRKGVDDDDEAKLEKAPSGYLWDACNRAGLGYRSYGEYGKRVSTGDGAVKME